MPCAVAANLTDSLLNCISILICLLPVVGATIAVVPLVDCYAHFEVQLKFYFLQLRVQHFN